MTFKYLEANVTSNGNLKEKVQACNDQSSHDVHAIHETCVRPIMTYAIEMRAEPTDSY